VLSVDDKRRLVRRLLERQGRGFAEAYGFRVTNNPGGLFRLLYLSMLASGRRDYRRGVRVAQAVRDAGWDSAARLAAADPSQRVAAVRAGGAVRDANRLAGMLGDLAKAVVDRYGGDLRRLPGRARRDPAAERRALTELPGIDDRTVDVFLREVQVIWPETGPFADRRALRAANRLGLARTVPELTALTGGESERLAWLAGALARVDLDNSYDEVRALTTAAPER
jgi:endonuclease III